MKMQYVLYIKSRFSGDKCMIHLSRRRGGMERKMFKNGNAYISFNINLGLGDDKNQIKPWFISYYSRDVRILLITNISDL